MRRSAAASSRSRSLTARAGSSPARPRSAAVCCPAGSCCLPRARAGTAPARDELGELSDTLNRMLAALERARETERRFLADASHELRTPLTSLRGNAAYIARHGAEADALADLEADAARLGRLLDDLLAL